MPARVTALIFSLGGTNGGIGRGVPTTHETATKPEWEGNPCIHTYMKWAGSLSDNRLTIDKQPRLARASRGFWKPPDRKHNKQKGLGKFKKKQ